MSRIVGYTLNADVYCDGDCVILVLGSELYENETAENALDRIADELGINRSDERSFDSSEFPKVILSSDESAYLDHCGCCMGKLFDHECSEHTSKMSRSGSAGYGW